MTWPWKHLHDPLDQRLGQQPGLVQQPPPPVDVVGADETRARDEGERGDAAGEVAGKGDGQAAAQRVADQVEAVPAQPRRGQHEQHLRHVERGAVVDVGGGVGVAAAEVVCSAMVSWADSFNPCLFMVKAGRKEENREKD